MNRFLATELDRTFDNFTPDTFQLINMANGSASTWFSNVMTPAGRTLLPRGMLVPAIPEPTPSC